MSTNNPMSNIPPLGQPTGMMPGGGPSKFKPVDPLRVLRANWLWLFIALVIGAGIGGGIWFALNKYMAEYTSDAQFDVQATNIEGVEGRGGGGALRMAEIEPWILREVQAFLATPVLMETLNDPAVRNTSWFKQHNGDLDEALEDLSTKVLKATHIRDTPLFLAQATTQKEEDAQTILRAIRDEYLRRKQLRVTSDSKLALDAATQRMDTAQGRIEDIENDVAELLDNRPIESLDERSTQAALEVNRLVYLTSDITSLLNSVQASYTELKKRVEANNFDPSDEERLQIENAQDILRIDAILSDRRVRRMVLSKQLGEKHKQVVDLDQEILALEHERQQEYDKQALTLFNSKLEQAELSLRIYDSRLKESVKSLDSWKKKRETYVSRKQEYDKLERRRNLAEEEREDANRAIEDLKQIDNTDARVVVVESVPPQKANQSFPPKPYVLVPGFAIFLAGLVTGLIFLREIMDQRVRSAADVKMIPDAALLGMIPGAKEDYAGGKRIERVVEEQPAGLLAEAFRQVRTAVLSKTDRRGYKTLMLVSAKPGAGVTSIAQNLGASCALSGRRVLLVDANFRRPAMAKLVGVNEEPGLADLLCGDQPIEQAASLAQATSTQGLSVLPAGNTARGAVELFENPRFRELLALLEAEYDLLIIDAPPALLTSDAQLLSRHIDAMVLVSRAQVDTRGMLERLYRQLDGQRADILGIVLNGVQASVGGYLKRNFREFHDYSGPERRKAARTATAKRATPTSLSTNGNGSAAAKDPASVSIATDEKPDNDDDPFNGFDVADDDDKQR